MLKILWERGEIAPEEQFLLLSTCCYLMLDSGFSLTPYLESFTPTFGQVTPIFPRISSNLHCRTPLFLKDVSGTPVFKILVRTLRFLC